MSTAESLTSPSAYLSCRIVSNLAELWVEHLILAQRGHARLAFAELHIWMNLMHRVRAML